MAQHGKVVLVGAGPSDLLTPKAVKTIAQGNVFFVDNLVNPEILRHAQQNARVIHVGKRGGCQSISQAFIERLIVLEACAGQRLVDLKGCDTYLFGRGGEEQVYLQAQGMTV